MQLRKNPLLVLPSSLIYIPTAEPQWVVPSEGVLCEQVSGTWEEKQAPASFAKHLKHAAGPGAARRKQTKISSNSYKYAGRRVSSCVSVISWSHGLPLNTKDQRLRVCLCMSGSVDFAWVTEEALKNSMRLILRQNIGKPYFAFDWPLLIVTGLSVTYHASLDEAGVDFHSTEQPL